MADLTLADLPPPEYPGGLTLDSLPAPPAEAAPEKPFFGRLGESVRERVSHPLRTFKESVESEIGLGRGIAEVGTEMATGTAATALGAGVGAGVSAREGEEAGIAARKNVREALTYKPRSPEGKAAERTVSTLTAPIGAGAQRAGEFVAGLTGSELTGQIASDVGQFAVPEAAGKVGSAAIVGARSLLRPSEAAAGTKAAGIARDMRERGMVIPPKDIPGAGVVQRNIGGFAGKERTWQLAQQRNQTPINEMFKEDLGIDKAKSIPEGLREIRERAGAVYKELENPPGREYYVNYSGKLRDVLNEEAANLPALAEQYPSLFKSGDKVQAMIEDLSKDRFEPADAVRVSQRLREIANQNSRKAELKADVNARDLARVSRRLADAMDDMFEENLQIRKPDLAARFKQARRDYARATDLARVTDHAGDVRLEKLYGLYSRSELQAMTKGSVLTGAFRRGIDMYSQFPKATHSAQYLGGEEGLTVFDVWFGTGELLAGHPAGTALALGRPLIRGRVQFSEAMQRVPGMKPRARRPRLPSGTLGSIGALSAPTGESNEDLP